MNMIVLFLVLVLTLNFVLISASGFGSTYLETIDGKKVMTVNQNEVKSYFIYLQNSKTSIEPTKIEVSDINNIVKNNLSAYYNVPGKTMSSDYPVEFIIQIPSDAVKGQVYEIKYYISYSSNNDNAIVSFAPTSYDKVFYVSVGEPNWTTLNTNKEALTYQDLNPKTTSKIISWFKDLFSNDKLEVGSDSELLKRRILKTGLGIVVILVPIIIIGGGIYYVYKRKKKNQ